MTTANTYTLSLHDALPILDQHNVGDLKRELKKNGLLHRGSFQVMEVASPSNNVGMGVIGFYRDKGDRKSTRLNSSHVAISYAVFCLKKKRKKKDKYKKVA